LVLFPGEKAVFDSFITLRQCSSVLQAVIKYKQIRPYQLTPILTCCFEQQTIQLYFHNHVQGRIRSDKTKSVLFLNKFKWTSESFSNVFLYSDYPFEIFTLFSHLSQKCIILLVDFRSQLIWFDNWGKSQRRWQRKRECITCVSIA